MKVRWWIAVFLLVALGLPFQPGCANRGEPSTQAPEDGPVDTVEPLDTEVPEP